MDSKEIEFEERIFSLKSELQQYGNEIINHINGLYANISGFNDTKLLNINLKNDPRNSMKIFQHDVTEIMLEATSLRDYEIKHKNEINECKDLVEIIKKVVVAADTVAICDDYVSGTNLIGSCDALLVMDNAMDKLPGPNSILGAGFVCITLRKECQMLHSRFSSRIRRLLGNCIQFENGRITVLKSLKGMLRGEDILLDYPIQLVDIWSALVRTGCYDECVQNVVFSVWFYIICPLWKERKVQSATLFHTEEQSELLFDSVSRNSTSSSLNIGGTSTINSTVFNKMDELESITKSLTSSRIAFPHLLSQIGQVMDFFSTEILCSNIDILSSASKTLSSEPISFIDTMISTLLSFIPKSESELLNFQKLIEKPCKEFESRLISFGFEVFESFNSDISSSQNVSLDKNDNLHLSKVVVDLIGLFADARRKDILSRARELLLCDYHNTMLAAGDAAEDDPASAGDVGDSRAMLLDQSGSFAIQVLHFEQCQVSLASCRLLKLVHEVMKQACVASPQVTNILFQTGRDCIELFMAIIPMKFSDVIETVPRMGAVFFNDCIYISHNCTLITHKYRKELGIANELLLDTAGFVDFIPRLRVLGEERLLGHVEEQQNILSQLLSSVKLCTDSNIDNNNNNSDPISPSKHNGNSAVGSLLLNSGFKLGGKLASRIDGAANMMLGIEIEESHLYRKVEVGYNDAEGAALLVRHLERLSGQWLGVLQESVYERVIGFLLEGVLRVAMQPVLDTDTITEEAGSDISRVFRTIQRSRSIFPNAKELIGSNNSSKNDGIIDVGDDRECQDSDNGMRKYSASWTKFCALTDLLEYSASEVAEWLPRRKFSSFTGNEMSSLIKALFEDSSRRQGILTAILEMSS
jgi:hypothetical protein